MNESVALPLTMAGPYWHDAFISSLRFYSASALPARVATFRCQFQPRWALFGRDWAQTEAISTNYSICDSAARGGFDRATRSNSTVQS
jgi:hypothetical protein